MADLPLSPLRVEELDLDEQPEVALLLTRNAIEARLDWLTRYLAPDEGRDADSMLSALKSRKELDSKTVRAIRDVLAATNPLAHGRSVSPSVAAVVADSAARVSAALDEMIDSLLGQLQGLPPRTRLAYAFLALPPVRRRAIARRLDLFDEDDVWISRQDIARTVFERAHEKGRLDELWTATAEESPDLQSQPPSGLE